MAFWSNVSGENSHEPLRQNRWFIFFGNSQIKYSLKEVQKPEYSVGFTEHRLITQTFKLPNYLKWKPISIKLIATVGEKETLDDILEGLLRQYGYKAPIEYVFGDSEEIILSVNIDKNILEKAKKFNIDYAKLQNAARYKIKEISKSTLEGNHQQISYERQTTSRVSRDENNNFDDFSKIKIVQIDENGIEIESWELFNCFLSSVKYGTLTYEQDGFVDINLTIEYDWALQEDTYYNNLSRLKAEKAAIEALKREQAILEDQINKKEQEALAKAKREAEYEKLRALEAAEQDLKRLAETGTDAQKAAAKEKLEELEQAREKEKQRVKDAEEAARIAEQDRIEELERRRDQEKLEADTAAERRKQDLERAAANEATAQVDALLADADAISGREKSDTVEGNDRVVQQQAEKRVEEEGKFLLIGETNKEKEQRLNREIKEQRERELSEARKAENEYRVSVKQSSDSDFNRRESMLDMSERDRAKAEEERLKQEAARAQAQKSYSESASRAAINKTEDEAYKTQLQTDAETDQIAREDARKATQEQRDFLEQRRKNERDEARKREALKK